MTAGPDRTKAEATYCGRKASAPEGRGATKPRRLPPPDRLGDLTSTQPDDTGRQYKRQAEPE